ncbi:MAG TPA: hypothetical protein VFT22_02710, partial [Kofleriaceae bacterium]|nr:hypothetical protein [Kofleriaceae bacterium]
ANSAALAALRPAVDRVVCLVDDPMLVAVGARYQEFEPVSEAEVASLVAASSPRGREGRIREAVRR